MSKIKIVKQAFRKEYGQDILIVDWFSLHEAEVIFYRSFKKEQFVKSLTLQTKSIFSYNPRLTRKNIFNYLTICNQKKLALIL
jgi:hypothetical protein